MLSCLGLARAAETPRLVVVVSIDQFPYEYLERIDRAFDRQGIFLRMCDDGELHKLPSWPCLHKDRSGAQRAVDRCLSAYQRHHQQRVVDPAVTKGKKPGQMYCVDDPAVEIVGGGTEDVGRSPKNLLVDTLGDVLKFTRPGSRVFGLSLKDRAAILMSGHLADGVLVGGRQVGHQHLLSP